jgi:hypothetical protein
MLDFIIDNDVDYEAAEHLYDAILTKDPYRIENIDVFCNILYVMDKRIKLSKLAHEFLQLNKNSPEVCYLVGESRNCSNTLDTMDVRSRQPLQSSRGT